MKWINPKIRDFSDQHPDITLVGLYWSMIWRFLTLVYGTIFLVAIFIAGIATLFE